MTEQQIGFHWKHLLCNVLLKLVLMAEQFTLMLNM